MTQSRWRGWTAILLGLIVFVGTPVSAKADDATGAFQGRASSMEGWAGALKGLMGLLSKSGVAKTVQASIDKQVPAAGDALRMSGADGVLFEVRFIETVTAETQKTELYNNNVLFVGAGSTPVNIVALAIRDQALEPGIPDGYRRTKDKDFYLWFKKDGDGFRMWNVIAKPTRQRARRIFANKALHEQLKSQMRNLALRNMGKAMLNNITKEDQQRRLKAMIESRDKALERISQIHQNLERELRKAEEANRAAKFFSMMSASFGFASAVLQVKESLGEEAPEQLSSAKSDSRVEEVLKEYENARHNDIRELRLEIIETRNEAGQVELQLINFYESHDVPMENISGLGANN